MALNLIIIYLCKCKTVCHVYQKFAFNLIVIDRHIFQPWL